MPELKEMKHVYSIKMYIVRGVNVPHMDMRRSKIQGWVRNETCRAIRKRHLLPGHAVFKMISFNKLATATTLP